jgi:signal transduction protein with GAF and PtsI domain
VMDSEFERQRLHEQLEECRETIEKLQKKIKDG